MSEEIMSEEAEAMENDLLVRIDEVRTLVEISQKELRAQTVKGNRSAGVRARKSLRAAKACIHELIKGSNAWGKEPATET